jgi:hypothetical protein
MCSISNYLGNNILNHVFSKSDYYLPQVYVGLLAKEPDKEGSSISEPDCPGYARAVTNASIWDTAVESLIENISNITFTMACENWGTMTYFALFDASKGGNVLAYGKLSPSKIINSGDIPMFAPGDLIVSLD